MVPELTDKYIIIRIASPDNFVAESLRTLWVDEENGIQEVMGKKSKSEVNEVQSYVFDKNKWTIEDARAWVRSVIAEHKETAAELIGQKRTFVTASVTLCETKPNLSVGTKVVPLTKKSFAAKNEAKAALNDKYFFYVEGVHEGANGNGDFFTRDELVKSYKSAGYQLIDWEHLRDQVIGFSLESELITPPGEGPVAVAFTGIINRLSPAVQAEERIGDVVVSRDELIRNRFFEDKLAVSMECLFDSMECGECGYHTADAFDFEFHCIMNHPAILEAGRRVERKLVGVDFMGWGFVETPADHGSYVMALRTSDDGTIKDIIDASARDQFGIMAGNVVFAQQVSMADPSDLVISGEKLLFASEKDAESGKSTTKSNNNGDNKLEKKANTDTIDIVGGKQMFNLAEKISAGMTLSDILVACQKVLRDFQGDKPLDTEQAKAFATELGEVVTEHISKNDFRVANVYTVTDEQKLSAIDAARTEEQAVATAAKNEADTKYAALEASKGEVEATLVTTTEELNTLKVAEAKKETDKKVDAFMEEIKTAGIVLTAGVFEDSVRQMVESKIDDEDGLGTLKTELFASFKQSVLEEASKSSGASAGGSADEGSSLEAKMEAAKNDINKK